jgi:hypothetical protein
MNCKSEPRRKLEKIFADFGDCFRPVFVGCKADKMDLRQSSEWRRDVMTTEHNWIAKSKANDADF